ncbi:MAG TPA: type II toxin-antitoxin system HicB family antitoxin [Anaerolineales bacterium]|nr:type II toxin-antitoxin system HicB family antitoxin [Anaerolineales bacterium]
MPYIVCAEEMDGQWIAHVPDLPGCFSTHKERETAIGNVPAAVEAYIAWAGGHGLRISGLSAPMIVSEVVRSWMYEEDYEVNAFFASDRPPVSVDELPEYDLLLGAARKDLMALVQPMAPETLEKEFSGERWPIGGIMHHVARAEHWYLDRLGLSFSRNDLAQDPFQALAQVREHLRANLPALANRTGAVSLSGEVWTARKVLRRCLWHERDHTEHIRKLSQRTR